MTPRPACSFKSSIVTGLFWLALFAAPLAAAEPDRTLSLTWHNEMLTIHGKHLPGGALDVWYKDFPGQERRTSGRGAGSPGKKLIEFGWDEPDTGFMRRHRDQLEQSPFDGCVFHITARGANRAPESFTWLCWGRRRFTEAELEPALADLAALAGSRFRHNFLRFNVTPADLDWFDDHTAVVSNARLAARLARAGGGPGILLDTEAYQGVWIYSEKPRWWSEKGTAIDLPPAYVETVRRVRRALLGE